jgi:hypothetical protein
MLERPLGVYLSNSSTPKLMIHNDRYGALRRDPTRDSLFSLLGWPFKSESRASCSTSEPHKSSPPKDSLPSIRRHTWNVKYHCEVLCRSKSVIPTGPHSWLLSMNRWTERTRRPGPSPHRTSRHPWPLEKGMMEIGRKGLIMGMMLIVRGGKSAGYIRTPGAFRGGFGGCTGQSSPIFILMSCRQIIKGMTGGSPRLAVLNYRGWDGSMSGCRIVHLAVFLTVRFNVHIPDLLKSGHPSPRLYKAFQGYKNGASATS